MNSSNYASLIPLEFQKAPWLKSIIDLLQEQSRVIQEQSKVIQEQSKVIQEQKEQITALKRTVQELKDEISRQKKMPKRPKYRPGGGNPKSRSGKPGTTTSNVVSKMTPQKEQHEIRVSAVNVPKGSRFKGYQTYTIQELEISPKDIIYKLEVWQSPEGGVIRAELPPEAMGSHFGYQLRALVHNLYSLGMTEPGLFDLLSGTGIEISEGQIHHILMHEAEAYHKESERILTAGMEEAPYIRTDDTGEKHQHRNVYCTHIGGEYFAYYTTTSSKSRENFLRILLQGKEGYSINQAFIWHLFQCGVEDDLLNQFEDHVGKTYCKKKGLNELLNRLGIGNKKLRRHCLEAGLVGFISETVLKPGQVLLSDRAGQFAVFDHAGCWVHMERPLRKIEAATEKIEREIQRVREAIWILYGKLKEAALTQSGKSEVHELYDQLIAMKSTSPGVTEVIGSFAKWREEMLKALDHPGLPLHNNDSERDIRGVAKRRNISGTTKSEEGRKFRDGLLTLKQTCARLGVSFWGYLTGWFKQQPLEIAKMVRQKYREAAALGPSG
jgi:transposase IS66 family protein